MADLQRVQSGRARGPAVRSDPEATAAALREAQVEAASVRGLRHTER